MVWLYAMPFLYSFRIVGDGFYRLAELFGIASIRHIEDIVLDLVSTSYEFQSSWNEWLTIFVPLLLWITAEDYWV
jgi:hypothetical protein